MKRNAVPGLIALSPAILLPLVQNIVRPAMPHAGVVGFILGSAPNFIIAFCFPFSILIRPRAWTGRMATNLFYIWSLFTLAALVAFEFRDPFGPQTFDPADIGASAIGVAMAIAVYHAVLRARLTFGTGSAVGAQAGVDPRPHASKT